MAIGRRSDRFDMAIFFTSDTHFGHAGALGLYRRPFPSVEAMDEAMIERWNATVGPEDEVWHLGDMAVGPGILRIDTIMKRLNGRKRLLAGNNDPQTTTRHPGWQEVHHYAEVEVEGARLVLCHYAFRTWRGMHKGWINLHGHSHGRLSGITRQYDVGVDVWNFRPVRLEEILASRRRRRISDPDASP